MMSIVEPFREFRNRSENRPNVTSTRDIYAGSLLAPARRPLTLCAAATISPPPTRRAASTARLTRLLLSSDLLRVAAWVVVGLCLGSGFALVVGSLFVFLRLQLTPVQRVRRRLADPREAEQRWRASAVWAAAQPGGTAQPLWHSWGPHKSTRSSSELAAAALGSSLTALSCGAHLRA